MLEHGMIKIRRKIDEDALLTEMNRMSESFDTKYKFSLSYYINESGYVTRGVNRELHKTYFGRLVGIVACRNSKGKITLLVIRKQPAADEKVLEEIVNGLVEFTGGKFHAGV